MAHISITVPGEPVAKGRPRMTKGGHVYTPAKTVRYEKQIRDCWKAQSGEKLDGPISAIIVAYYKIPKSAKKPVQKDMAAGIIRPTKRPDIDNVVKTLDALNGHAFDDDSQIVEIRAEKRYSENPRVVIDLANFLYS